VIAAAAVTVLLGAGGAAAAYLALLQPEPEAPTPHALPAPFPTPAATAAPKPKPKPKPTTNKTKPKVEVPKGPPPKKLVVKDLETGKGPGAKSGDEVTVEYVGVDYKTGKQFDASWDRGEPFSFELGSGGVIAGWEQGIEGMKVGGRRELIIPPELAYGPEKGTLVFVVDMLAIE